MLDYNNALQEFPSSIFANAFHFVKYDFFQTQSEAEREPVKVDFGDLNSAPSQKSGGAKSSGSSGSNTQQGPASGPPQSGSKGKSKGKSQ